MNFPTKLLTVIERQRLLSIVRFGLIVCGFWAFQTSVWGQNDTLIWHETANIRADELEVYFNEKQYEKYAEMNYPRLVETMGGAKAFAEMMKDQMEQIEKEVTIDSFYFGEPRNFVKCDGMINCLLPQTMVIVAKDSSVAVRSTTYLLGLSEDGGQKWYFIDASNGPNYLDIIVPNRCKELAIPSRKQDMFTPRKKL